MSTGQPLPPLPSTPEAFSDPTERWRLSPVAVKAFKDIATRWGLSFSEGAALTGMSEADWVGLQLDASARPLTQDQLTRVSALVGLYKGLAETFSENLAARWPRLRNAGPIFRNRTPIEA